MGKKNLLVMAASIFLATANAPTATAQEVGGVEISTTSILPITGVTAATDGNYNFKSFEVEHPKQGRTIQNSGFCPASMPTIAIPRS